MQQHVGILVCQGQRLFQWGEIRPDSDRSAEGEPVHARIGFASQIGLPLDLDLKLLGGPPYTIENGALAF